MRLITLACMITAATAAAPSQQAPFKSKSEIVEVYATVTRRGGALVRNLTQDDFELFEDGKRREIAVFSSERRSISVSILLDRSGSTASAARHILAAGRAFAGQLAEGDRASVSTLMWGCLPFTDEFSALTTVLTRLPGDYGSPIWSAVDHAVTTLTAETGRRVILLMSDGVDAPARIPLQELRWILPEGTKLNCSFNEPSRISLKDVIRRAEQEAVMVYSITVDPRSPEAGVGASNMARLSGDTGGGFRLLSDTSYLRSAFTSIADELRMQYLLGFVPSHTDGKRHEIKVRLKSIDASVRAREAYVAAKR